MTTEHLATLRTLAKRNRPVPRAADVFDLTRGLQDALDEISRLQAANAALASALRPLACLLDWIEGEGGLPDSTPVAASRYLCVGDLRRAAEAMGRVEMRQREEGNECE